VVGAPYEDSNQTYLSNGTGANSDNSLSGAGAAYVYKRTGSAWAQEAYLKAGSPDVGDYYGLSVGVSGDTVVVGALNEDGNQNFITNGTSDTSTNGLGNSGAAYVYIRTGTVWEQQAYIKASNVDFYDYFGFSVSISGDTIVAGADYESGNYNYIWNGPIAGTNDSLSYSGAVYVFKRDGTIWHQEAYLKPPNPDSNDRLGYHVSISGDIIAATAIYESSSQQFNSYGSNASADNSQDKSGAVYVFKRNGVNWSQNAYLKAPNGASMDYFGYNCAVSGDTIVIGAHPESSGQRGIVNNISAPMDNSSLESGAVYIIRE
jgi:hypothetical protein